MLFVGAGQWFNRDMVNSLIWKRMESRLEKYVPENLHKSDEIIDLDTKGGIRNDAEGVEIVRKEQLNQLEQASLEEIPDFKNTILRDIKELVQNNGGQVVLYEMPISNITKRQILAKYSLPDLETVQMELKLASLPILQTDTFLYGDEDFPDLSHLRSSRKGEFSLLLAEKWIEHQKSIRTYW